MSQSKSALRLHYFCWHSLPQFPNTPFLEWAFFLMQINVRFSCCDNWEHIFNLKDPQCDSAMLKIMAIEVTEHITLLDQQCKYIVYFHCLDKVYVDRNLWFNTAFLPFVRTGVCRNSWDQAPPRPLLMNAIWLVLSCALNFCFAPFARNGLKWSAKEWKAHSPKF